MSSYAISGKPGGGKSLYALSLIIKELVETERIVVTNLALKLPELNEYLQKKYPQRNINLFERVQLLDDEQVRKFYLYRGTLTILDVSKEEWKQSNRLDYSGSTQGVFYVLDEIHVFLNSRAWMETGEGVLFYMSQHRKLGDDVVWITQHINNVDKQFKSVTQDYTYVRNFRKEKFGKYFRRGEGFRRFTYLEPYTSSLQKPVDMVDFKLDAELADCYDTAAGIGIRGANGGDKGEKVNAIPIKYFYAGLFLLIVLITSFFIFAPQIINKVTTGFFSVPKQQQAQVAQPIQPSKNTTLTSLVSSTLQLPTASEPKEKPSYAQYTFKNRPAEIEAFKELVSGVTLKFDSDLNTVIYSGPPDKLSIMSLFLRQADVPPKQVRLKFILCSASLTDNQEFSFEWLFQYISSGLVSPQLMALAKITEGIVASGALTNFLQLSVEAASKKGDLHIITRPQIVVQSGKTGLLRSGREVAVPNRTVQNGVTNTGVDFRTVALEVEVQPHVLNDKILLNINQKNDDIARTITIDSNQIPELSTQVLKTSITMKSGDWASVGGITILSKNKTATGIPWLMDIPGIGVLFKKTTSNKERIELGILVQAEILEPEQLQDLTAEEMAPPELPAPAGNLESRAAAGGT